MQQQHEQWRDQWLRFKDDSLFLFREWIYPNRLEDFRGQRVLDVGCGHGHHMLMVAPYAREIVGVDLNTVEIARQETRHLPNARVLVGDAAIVDFSEPFDAVYCIGVIHHTDNPDNTFRNLKRLTRPNGKLIVWAYSHEGNFLNRTLLEWLKKVFFLRLKPATLMVWSYFFTFLLYPIVWTLYLLPLRGVLPFYDYFGNFRILPFRKNLQNVFDKLIAPQTHFIHREQVLRWFNEKEFRDVHIDWYKGISWRCSGVKK